MGADSAISWTDHTFNPWFGCTKVSPACDHCYAERLMDTRMHKVQWGGPRVRTSAANWKMPLRWNAQAARDDRRYRVFCASLADVFDNEVEPSWRAELFALIACTPHLDWLLLTKRIGNVARMIEAPGMQKCGLPPNVWLGATVVNQEEADRDIPKLLATPPCVRFLSIEPMLGPIDLRRCVLHSGPIELADTAPPEWRGITTVNIVTDALAHGEKSGRRIDWVICGGESGPQARPMHPDWARSLRDQCAAAGVPFHFKQWGGWAPYDRGRIDSASLATPGSTDMPMQRFGVKLAGRLLDGVEHNGVPT